jgi:hypothetical protein
VASRVVFSSIELVKAVKDNNWKCHHVPQVKGFNFFCHFCALGKCLHDITYAEAGINLIRSSFKVYFFCRSNTLSIFLFKLNSRRQLPLKGENTQIVHTSGNINEIHVGVNQCAADLHALCCKRLETRTQPVLLV